MLDGGTVALVWTTIALVASVFHVLMLRQVKAELDSYRAQPYYVKNGRDRLGRGAVRGECVFLFLQALFIIYGVKAFIEDLPVDLFTGFMRMMAASILVSHSFLNWRDRQLLMRRRADDN